jgi:hypothetical protein
MSKPDDTRELGFWHLDDSRGKEGATIVLDKMILFIDKGGLPDNELDDLIEDFKEWQPVINNYAKDWSVQNEKRYCYLMNVLNDNDPNNLFIYQQAVGHRWDETLGKDIMAKLELKLVKKFKFNSYLHYKPEDGEGGRIDDWEMTDWKVVPDANFPSTRLVHDVVVWTLVNNVPESATGTPTIQTIHSWIPY